MTKSYPTLQAPSLNIVEHGQTRLTCVSAVLAAAGDRTGGEQMMNEAAGL